MCIRIKCCLGNCVFPRCVFFRPIWVTGSLTWDSVSTTRFWCRTAMRTLTSSQTSAWRTCKRSESQSSVRRQCRNLSSAMSSDTDESVTGLFLDHNIFINGLIHSYTNFLIWIFSSCVFKYLFNMIVGNKRYNISNISI